VKRAKFLEGVKVSVWLSGQIGEVDFIRVGEGDCSGQRASRLISHYWPVSAG
jgi:hypothetical protein